MNRYLVVFYLSGGAELRDIWESDMDIKEFHADLLKAMESRSYYEMQSVMTDTSRITLLWSHVLYFEITLMGYPGTQPINLDVEDEEQWQERQPTN